MKKKSTRPGYYVGVDVGGSKIMAGVFTHDLKLIHSQKVSTKVHRGTDNVLDRIASCVREVAEACQISVDQVTAVGVGTPGVVKADTGTVIIAPNLRWKNVKLKATLTRALKRPVVVENDSKLAMLGIHEIELRRKPKNAIGVFLGTGIGGAFIINGDLYSGSSGIAGEVGHMMVAVDGPVCACGNRACFEVYASRSGIANRLRAAIKGGARTPLRSLLEEDQREPGALKSGVLRKAFKEGDPLVRRIVHEAAERTGFAIANLINMLSPEVVVLGGGVIEALGREMLPIVKQKARAHSLLRFLHEPHIFTSKLADNAGISGAAVLARNHVH